MDVHVNLVRKEQDYRPPTPPKYVAFSGGGRTLGSTSAADAAAAPPAPAPPANPTSSNELVIDDTQPVRALSSPSRPLPLHLPLGMCQADKERGERRCRRPRN